MRSMENAHRWIQSVALVVIAAAVMFSATDRRSNKANNIKRGKAYAALARAAMEAKDPQLAAHAWSKALDADPGNPSWRSDLLRATVEQILEAPGVINPGNVLALQSELADALVSKGEPDARLLLAFGRVLQFRGRHDEARARYEEAARKQPDLAMAHLLLGDNLLKAKKFDGAAAALAKAVELDNKNHLTWFALGQVRLKQEKYGEAIEALETAVKGHRTGQVYLALGRAYVAKEDWKKAEPVLEKALGLGPNLRGVHRLLADAYANNQRIQLAIGAYKLAWERDSDVEGYRRLGRIYSQMQMHNEALKVWSDIQAVDMSDPEPHCQMGTNAEHLRDIALAKAAYERCIKRAGEAKGKEKEKWGTMVQQARLRLAEVEKVIAKVKAEQKDGKGKKGKRKRGG